MWVLGGGKRNASLFCNSNYEASFLFLRRTRKKSEVEGEPFVLF